MISTEKPEKDSLTKIHVQALYMVHKEARS